MRTRRRVVTGACCAGENIRGTFEYILLSYDGASGTLSRNDTKAQQVREVSTTCRSQATATHSNNPIPLLRVAVHLPSEVVSAAFRRHPEEFGFSTPGMKHAGCVGSCQRSVDGPRQTKHHGSMEHTATPSVEQAQATKKHQPHRLVVPYDGGDREG